MYSVNIGIFKTKSTSKIFQKVMTQLRYFSNYHWLKPPFYFTYFCCKVLLFDSNRSIFLTEFRKTRLRFLIINSHYTLFIGIKTRGICSLISPFKSFIIQRRDSLGKYFVTSFWFPKSLKFWCDNTFWASHSNGVKINW